MSRSDANRGARNRIQNQRIAEARRKRDVLIASTGVVVVVGVLAVLIGVKVGSSGGSTAKAATSDTLALPAAAQTAAIASMATGVPAATLQQVGTGTADRPPTTVKAPPLMANGKPEVLYIGAEYCPFCAAERWPLVVALSRFGTFSHLGLTESSSTDVFPNTRTFSFVGSTYTSPYLSFVPVETQDRQGKTLQKPTADQKRLVLTYDMPGTQEAGAIPFVDFGGAYVGSGSGFQPGVLKGMDWNRIAAALGTPTNSTAKAVDGTANQLTAVLCKLTNGKPGDVCTTPLVSRIQGQLK